MKNFDATKFVIFTAVLSMRKCRLTRTRKSIYRSNELRTILKRVLFLSAVTCCITITISKGPSHCKCTLLMLTKVSHTKNCCAVLVSIEVAKCKWIRQARIIYIWSLMWNPLRIRENINIWLFAISNWLRILIHLNIFIRHILEVKHPVI